MRDRITSRTKLLLGGGVLELEVDTVAIGQLIDIAYDKIKPFIADSILVSRAFSSVINLADENIVDVIRVYPAESSIYTQDRMFDFEGIKLDRMSIHRSILGSYPVINSELNFKFNKPLLYLESDKVYSGQITIEGLYTPQLEDLKDERAISWIESYTLALAKQVCGRIRSKFKSSNVPVELDGDTLLSEAQSEIQTLEAELQDRQFGPFMVIR